MGVFSLQGIQPQRTPTKRGDDHDVSGNSMQLHSVPVPP